MTEANDQLHTGQGETDPFGPLMLVKKMGRRPIQPKRAHTTSGPVSKDNKFKALEEDQVSSEKTQRGRKTNKSGPSMTWTNNKKGLTNTMERLDRALCNSEWRTMFPEATVRILPRTYSDHSPLLVYTQGMHQLNPLNRPFRFEAAWMTHPGLIDVINSSWTNMNHNLIDSTADFTCKVKEWNRVVFGNIFKRKRHLLARIEGLQKCLANNFSHSLQILEKELITQYNSTLYQEEILWFQKARSKHILLGDRNTR
ncbi:hypothetical protein ACSBR2_037579 [Camellia fascicularis]